MVGSNSHPLTTQFCPIPQGEKNENTHSPVEGERMYWPLILGFCIYTLSVVVGFCSIPSDYMVPGEEPDSPV